MPNPTPLIGLLLLAAFSPAVNAAELKTLRLADATDLTYAVALPDGYDGGKTYPVLLALPPGPQTTDMVKAGLDSYWEAEGTARGYIVVSPTAPRRQLFFQGGERILPEFMAHITQTYSVAGEKFHLAGVSNGGLSAFKVAVDHPDKFQSLTVIPGFPPSREVFAQLQSIAGLTITMFVGEQDSSWREPMADTAKALKGVGNDVYMEVIPNNGHFVTALSGGGAARIFDQIER